MKKGQEYIGTVEAIEFPNKGIVRVEDEKAIVKNAITGQKVRFLVNKARHGKCEGRLLEVIKKSSLETIEAECMHFGDCGGCTYQTVPYETQLFIKKEQVQKLLNAVLGTEYKFEGIYGSPNIFGYRNKMEFSFGDERKDGPLSLGLHKRGSFYDILTTSECKIVDSDYNQILSNVLSFTSEGRLTYYHKLTHIGYLRHLLVRKAAKTGEILIHLITSSQTDCISNENRFCNEEIFLQKFQTMLLNLSLKGNIVGILHTVNDSLADVIQSDKTRLLYGQDYFMEELLGLRFKISSFSFFQTNSLGAEVLYQKAREFIGDTKDKLIFDLYSGTGTIAQLLAPVAKKVIGVEIVQEAVLAAKENAAINRLDHCEFIAGDVLKVIDTIDERPDLIVLDPPRDGIHPKALDKIIDYGVESIVYISCKPTSLARDLAVFVERGYEVKRVACVDMFPGTVHVETVVLLSRKAPNDHIEVDLDLDELDATSAETKATYEEIKDYVLKETGLRVSSLYISQIKRKCGLEVGENYNLAKNENARVPQCPQDKEKAIRAALKHFAMI